MKTLGRIFVALMVMALVVGGAVAGWYLYKWLSSRPAKPVEEKGKESGVVIDAEVIA